MKWQRLDDNKPFAVETGEWDGCRSDELLVRTITGRKHVVHMYIGHLDGSDFINFYDANTDYEVSHVTHWLEIEEP